MTGNTPTSAIFIRSRSGRATACASSRCSTPTAVGKVQAIFSAKVKHRSRIQLTIGQRTRVLPGVAREPVADPLVVAQDAGARRQALLQCRTSVG